MPEFRGVDIGGTTRSTRNRLCSHDTRLGESILVSLSAVVPLISSSVRYPSERLPSISRAFNGICYFLSGRTHRFCVRDGLGRSPCAIHRVSHFSFAEVVQILNFVLESPGGLLSI